MSKKGYVETPTSKKARGYIEEGVRENKLRPELMDLKFDPKRREELSDSDGKLDPLKIYNSLGLDYQTGELIIRAVELNMTPEEMRAVIKKRNEILYSDWPKDNPLSGRIYKLMCKEFDLEP